MKTYEFTKKGLEEALKDKNRNIKPLAIGAISVGTGLLLMTFVIPHVVSAYTTYELAKESSIIAFKYISSL